MSNINIHIKNKIDIKTVIYYSKHKDYMEKIISINKKAQADYEFLDIFEAGIKLTGAETKSIKTGQANLKGSWAVIGVDRVPRLLGCSISRYAQAGQTQENYDPTASRILLLNKKQIKSLIGKLKEKKLSLIPTKIYSKSGLIKIEIALAKGKKQYEKRNQIKKRDIERDLGRKLKS